MEAKTTFEKGVFEFGRIEHEFRHWYPRIKHYPSTDQYQDDVWFASFGPWSAMFVRCPAMVEYEL